MSLYLGKEAVKMGDKYVYKDNRTARLWYLKALEDTISRNIALRKLLELERKMGNYKMAREYANMLLDCRDVEAYYFLGKVESIECNYLTALDYYSRALSSNYSDLKQLVNLKFIANIYTQLGEFLIARRMYETLILNSSSRNIGLLELINLDIIEGDFKHGLKLCEKLDVNCKEYKDTFRSYYSILMYNLGRINELNSEEFEHSFTYNRLISNDEKLLLKHLVKHCKTSDLIEIIFDSKETVDMILRDIPNIIKNNNPVYFTGSLIYKSKLNYNIGTYDGKPIDGLAVVMQNDKVFTMYPLLLSSEFDKEGMIYSESLSKKRSMGVRK